MRRRVAVGLLVGQIVLFAFAPGTIVHAIHSVTVPHEVFDFDNDGIAEASDSILPYQKRGGDWTTARTSRATEAMGAWSSHTDFNPYLSSASQNQDVWIDGSQPLDDADAFCPPAFNTWIELGDGDPTTVFAVNCRHVTDHGTYIRNNDSDIFLNTDNITFSWTTSSSSTPSARGVLTHEIGHGATLDDVYPPFNCTVSGLMVTMCGAVTDQQTWFYYTLTDDDIDSADQMYLP